MSVCTFVSMAPSYKQPFACSWLSEKACWTNRWRTWLFYLGNIFLTLQEEALLLLSGFIYRLSHKECVCLKNSPVLCLWLLWATQRYIFMHLCCKRDFLRRVWEAPFSRPIVLVYRFIWYGLRNLCLSCILWGNPNSQKFWEDGPVCS